MLLACALLCMPLVAQSGSGQSQDTQSSGGTDQSSTSKKPSKKAKASGESESSTGSSQSASGLTAAEKHFLNDAAMGGLAEVELGQLASEKAGDSQVKEFGQRMVQDHSKANEELKSLASSKGVTPPTSPKPKDMTLKNKLSGMSGQQFDQQYMKAMVRDHQHDVAEFQKMANNAKDSDVKNFAAKTLPILQEHLKQAQSIEASMGGSSAADKTKSKGE